MNYSKAVFLYDDSVRAVIGKYEDLDDFEAALKPSGTTKARAKRVMFKTRNKAIVEGDICVVPSSTRWGFTTIKIVEVDVDPEIEDEVKIEWIAQRVDLDPYKRALEEETERNNALKKARAQQARANLKKTLLADIGQEELNKLPFIKS